MSNLLSYLEAKEYINLYGQNYSYFIDLVYLFISNALARKLNKIQLHMDGFIAITNEGDIGYEMTFKHPEMPERHLQEKMFDKYRDAIKDMFEVDKRIYDSLNVVFTENMVEINLN